MNFKIFLGSDIQGYHSVHIGNKFQGLDGGNIKLKWVKHKVSLFALVTVKREITLHLT